MQQLAGEHDVHDREVLHTRIEEWMGKMFQWHGAGDDWVIETDPLIAPHCKQLVLLLEERDRLGAELKDAQTQETVKTASMITAFAKMSAKLGELVEKNHENEEGLEARKASLNSWKHEKLQVIQLSAKKIQHQLNMVNVEIRKCMDLIIDAAQPESSTVPDEKEDAMMEELEQLMSNCSFSGDKSMLSAKTLVLGEQAPFSPEPQDAQTQMSMPTTPVYAIRQDFGFGGTSSV
eukprot:s480_g4.t1